MVRRHQRKPESQTRIAKERIEILINKADEVFDRNRSLSNRYVTLARKIAMKFKIKIPSGLKRKFCPHCYRFLKPGANLRVRLGEKRLIYYCLECRRFWRMPYIKEVKSRRKQTGSKTEKTSKNASRAPIKA